MIAAIVLEPFPLWLAGREVGPDVPLIVTEGGRVLHANAHAQAGGVQVGMRVSGALSRVPTLHVTPLSGPLVAASWAHLLGDLPAFSPRVEALGAGRALLTLTPGAVAELALALNARVGLAPTRELALLAALSAQSGQPLILQPGMETAFRRTLPLRVLCGVGLSADTAERLTWLGVQTVGELLAWSRAQQAAFLGAQFTTLKPYLHGVNSGGVQALTPPAELRAALTFDEPLFEPHALEAAAQELAGVLLGALGRQRPAHLSVRAGVAGLSLSAARTLKEDVRQAGVLGRAILRTLHDADAARYGIEQLEVTLAQLARPAVQGDLWGRAQAQGAAAQAEERYPGCMRRVQWLDTFSLAPGCAYQWVSRFTQDAPPPAAPAPSRLPAALTPAALIPAGG